MELKGFYVGGCLVIAEDELEAAKMYEVETGRKPYNQIIEKDLDETFCYFELHEIDEEDHKNIYDRRYPSDGRQLVSLKRPHAKKYKEMTGNKKEVIFLIC